MNKLSMNIFGILSLSIENINSVIIDYTIVCIVPSQSGAFIFSDDLAFIDHIHYCQFICALEVVERNLQNASCTVGPAESYKHYNIRHPVYLLMLMFPRNHGGST